MNYFSDKKIVVTGGAGFLGKYVVRKLEEKACAQIVVPRRATCDLRKWKDIDRLLTEVQPDLIIHLAGVVAGIGGTSDNPAVSFYDNLIMGTQLMEAARQQNVKKLVALGSVCSYPRDVSTPTREEDIWSGYPEETNAPYGMAKKMLLVQSTAYREQYGFNSICLIAANLYGPGDNFDPSSSHVIPALIRKFTKAVKTGSKEVVCWGDGTSTREFLYVEDCAESILLAAEFFDSSDPVNIGTGREISIRDLSELIARLTGFEGKIVWDTSKPKGQPRRCWDVSLAERAFGFRARKSFEEGLRDTVTWYSNNPDEQ